MKAFLLIAFLLTSAASFCQVFPLKHAGTYGVIVKEKVDTVAIASNIQFIKVDGKVYEIRRSTSIEEAKPPQGAFPQGWQLFSSQGSSVPAIGIVCDTLSVQRFGTGTISYSAVR